MMRLRKLEQKDAPLMLEWMHDLSIVKDMKTNFMEKTIDDCNNFIDQAQNIAEDLHLAIVDDRDIYMGTVSLKHINGESAELGITVRACSMGKGYSHYAVEEIICIGFEKMNLKRIFWCVSPLNKRAIHFYDKNDYPHVIIPFSDMYRDYTEDEVKSYLWYQVENKKYRN